MDRSEATPFPVRLVVHHEPDDDLTEQVRDALRHLYDYAYLQTHPLARFVRRDGDQTLSAGQQLGRHMQGAIAALLPEAASAAPSAANRRARLLRLRYLDEMEAPAVQRLMAISRSTYQREHAIALRAVTSLLHKRWFASSAPEAPGAPNAAESPPATGQDEPTFLTSFVGRERELADVDRLLDRARLVTLTGPPGAGKTRLAGEVAARRRGSYADGTRFVSLAAVRDAGEVASATARSLGVREAPGRPLADTVRDALRRRHLLLILDNFEQVVLAAPLVVKWLQAAPQVAVLATSRAPLQVSGEHAYLVPPLALPDSPAAAPANWEASEAVQLFAVRAQATQADFQLNDASGPVVAAICRRLDGLPLAIELAAARLGVFPAPALLARLDRRLPLLTMGAQDLPARQQTLRAAIDWSYDLLTPGQQAVFRRLAVFGGGCTLDAAERVCATGHQEIDVIAEMAALVHQGLLRRDEQADGEPRFAMLESIREYALERLVASGESEFVQRAHADYYLDLAEAGEGRFQYLDTRLLERLDVEHDNLRSALYWFRLHEAADKSGRLAGALTWYWLGRSDWTEGRHWLEYALSKATTEEPGAVRAMVLLGAGIFALAQGDLGPARGRLEQSVAIWRANDDALRLATALAGLASAAARDRDPAAWSIGAESLALFRHLRHERGVASLQQQLGSIATYIGHYAEARSLLVESRTYWLQAMDLANVASTDWRLGSLAMAQYDYRAARDHFEQSLAVCHQLAANDGIAKQAMAVALTRLGELDAREGDAERATARYQEALQIARALGDQDIVAWTLTALGRVARHQGEEEQARRLFREALQLRQAQGYAWGLLVCLGELAESDVQAGHRERAVHLFAAAARHRAAGPALAVDGDLSGYDPARTERHLAALRADLDPAAFATAWAAGETLSLEQAALLALNG